MPENPPTIARRSPAGMATPQWMVSPRLDSGPSGVPLDQWVTSSEKKPWTTSTRRSAVNSKVNIDGTVS